jgi:predicted phage tail protein
MLTQDIQNLLTTGGIKRQLEQAGLDFDYGQFIEARDWDVNNLGTLIDTLSTVPHTKTRTEKQKKGALGTILGVAATVAGAYFTGGASLMGAGATGGFLKKVGVGFGEMLGGEGAGLAGFGIPSSPAPAPSGGGGGGYGGGAWN